MRMLLAAYTFFTLTPVLASAPSSLNPHARPFIPLNKAPSLQGQKAKYCVNPLTMSIEPTGIYIPYKQPNSFLYSLNTDILYPPSAYVTNTKPIESYPEYEQARRDLISITQPAPHMLKEAFEIDRY